jgi:RimJ/RimL family protein N-acetyltransferase
MMGDARILGPVLKGWVVPPRPGPKRIAGKSVVLEQLDPDSHAADLFQAFQSDPSLWDYLFDGPFTSASAFHRWLRDCAAKPDMFFYVIRDLATDTCTGMASYLRIAPEAGSIEVGNICFGPALQRSKAATEAMYLMMKWVFDAGYRRYEWKCNALNMPSRRAAQRLGFSYEGIFRQAVVVKGRNRDTAWFAAIDKEWPALCEAYLAWLAPSNFDAAGKQRERLGDLTGLVRAASDPVL